MVRPINLQQGPQMTPEQTARHNLTDYRVEVVSRVIMPMQSTPTLKAGTRQWRCELFHDAHCVDASEWDESLQHTARAAETMLILKERELEVAAEKEALVEYDDNLCNMCSGSGEGYISDSTCWFCKGRGIAMVELEEA